jgi:hypothetical protein
MLTFPCGSELAREGGVSVDARVPGPASSLASQLPQDFVVNAGIENNADNCGSWLASDGGGRFSIDVD